MFSQKDIQHIERTIHSVACAMHKWCDLVMLGVKNLVMEICDDAQTTARYNNNNNNNNNNNYYYYYKYYYYPHALLKKVGDIAIASVRPTVRRSRYLLLNHRTEFNQIWCVSCSHKWGVQLHIFLAPSPRGLERGQKVKYHYISISKSIAKIFLPNFVCLLTHERYKTYQIGFSFARLGHAPGVGLGGIMGGSIFPGTQPDLVCKLLT